MRPVVLAAAAWPGGAIGRGGALPWGRIRGDFAFLRHVTLREACGLVMGRKTFEGLGKPLKGRVSVVVTRSAAERAAESAGGGSVCFVASVEDALALCEARGLRPVIFGGEAIYREFLQKRRSFTLHLTLVYAECKGDTFFPMELVGGEEMENITEEVAEVLEKEAGLRLVCENGKVCESGTLYSFFRLERGACEEGRVEGEKEKENR